MSDMGSGVLQRGGSRTTWTSVFRISQLNGARCWLQRWWDRSHTKALRISLTHPCHNSQIRKGADRMMGGVLSQFAQTLCNGAKWLEQQGTKVFRFPQEKTSKRNLATRRSRWELLLCWFLKEPPLDEFFEGSAWVANHSSSLGRWCATTKNGISATHYTTPCPSHRWPNDARVLKGIKTTTYLPARSSESWQLYVNTAHKMPIHQYLYLQIYVSLILLTCVLVQKIKRQNINIQLDVVKIHHCTAENHWVPWKPLSTEYRAWTFGIRRCNSILMSRAKLPAPREASSRA